MVSFYTLIIQFPTFSIMKQTKTKPKTKNNNSFDISKQRMHRIKSQHSKQVAEYVIQLQDDHNPLQQKKALKQLIKLCYNNKTNQFYICNNLNIPFHSGPISLTPIPQYFNNKIDQLYTLFRYLSKIKQSYICWIIYFDHDLGLLNIKLFTQYQLKYIDDLFIFQQLLVGVFIGQQYYPKVRAISTKSNLPIYQSNSLSTKTTKQTLLQKQNKVKKTTKSMSMKQKKLLRHQLNTTTKLQQIKPITESNKNLNKTQIKTKYHTLSQAQNLDKKKYRYKQP